MGPGWKALLDETKVINFIMFAIKIFAFCEAASS